jgi:hypothetical protein
LRKGAVYLSSSGSYTYPDGTGVQTTAFLNPDCSRVVVVVNKIYNELKLEVHLPLILPFPLLLHRAPSPAPSALSGAVFTFSLVQ